MKRIIEDAFTRAYNTMMHPAVQWRRATNWEIRYPRYPAPASEPVDHETNKMDYKVAYRDSIHHVRYFENYQPITSTLYVGDPINESIPEKLQRLNFLKTNEMNNDEAVKRATEQYEKTTGESVTQKVQVNEMQDEAWDTLRAKNFSREAMAFFVREQFQFINEANRELTIQLDYNDLYHPEIEEIKHLDMFSNDPVFRQVLVDQYWIFKQISEQKEKNGYQATFRGDPSFWHAIDDSFTPGKYFFFQMKIQENIIQTQASVKDVISHLDQKSIELAHERDGQEYHKEEKIPLPIKSKFVE